MKKCLLSVMLIALTICMFVGCYGEVAPKATYTAYKGFGSGTDKYIVVSSDGKAYLLCENWYIVYEEENGIYENGDSTFTITGTTIAHPGWGQFDKIESSCDIKFDGEESLTLIIGGEIIYSGIPK